MAGYNTEHIPVGAYYKGDVSERINNYDVALGRYIAYACGKEMPVRYSYRYKPAQNRKLCPLCESMYYPTGRNYDI